jgi:hypothetical protein
MANRYGPLDELDIKAKIMLTIWELTKNAGDKFATPAEIGKALRISPGYVRTIIQDIEDLPGPHLSENKYHAKGIKTGRKRICYRLNDRTVIKPATALILIELLKKHQDHYVSRDDFVDYMVDEYGMTRDGVLGRIREATASGYIEDTVDLDSSIRGCEQINVDHDYIHALAGKYKRASSRKSERRREHDAKGRS